MKSYAYYNENDPHAAQWLKNLISRGLIMDGEVDSRSIVDVTPRDVARFVRVGFFAGIGGWDYALRLAGWPEDRPVWHGSCPCQSFSIAGKGAGFKDPRHLWPEMFRLISECRPDTIFGEQVTAAIGHGWLDLVSADMEGSGYTVGAAVLPAASVGAYHQRHRLFWVADSQNQRREHESDKSSVRDVAQGIPPRELRVESGGVCAIPGGVANRQGREQWGLRECGTGDGPGECEAGGHGATGGMGHTNSGELAGRQSLGRNDESQLQAATGASGDAGPLVYPHSHGCQPGSKASTSTGYGDTSDPAGIWDDPERLPCRDGKYRPTQPGLCVLAPRISGRMVIRRTVKCPITKEEKEEAHTYSAAGALRGFGNAIVPQVAAQFIKAFMGD